MIQASRLEEAAVLGLEAEFGSGPRARTAQAPGRATLVGEHVDYVGGRVACLAIDRAVAVAARPSADQRWRVCSSGRTAERAEPAMAGDVGDRIFAGAVALERRGIILPPLEVGVAATLPEAAGLSSSAAVTCASLVAMLRLAHARLRPEELVAAALTSERDIVGVPVGELDQRAIVFSFEDSVLILDCADGSRERVAWPWPGVGLLVAGSGQSHDVGGTEYRKRRAAAELACRELGVGNCKEIGARWGELAADLRSSGRHIASETRRTDDAAAALRAADLGRLGGVLDASHRSLRDDLGVSTATVDAMVTAARSVAGCHGARLIGAGFGGSVLALVDREAATGCAAAMAAVAAEGGGASWLVRPSSGLEVTCADVLIAEPAADRRASL